MKFGRGSSESRERKAPVDRIIVPPPLSEESPKAFSISVDLHKMTCQDGRQPFAGLRSF